MGRGGRRDGAGARYKWAHGETKVIRVPIALADRVLEIAKILDQGIPLENVTSSKTIDFSGIFVQCTEKGFVVNLQDLLEAGYKIRPAALASDVRIGIDKGIWKNGKNKNSSA